MSEDSDRFFDIVNSSGMSQNFYVPPEVFEQAVAAGQVVIDTLESEVLGEQALRELVRTLLERWPVPVQRWMLATIASEVAFWVGSDCTTRDVAAMSEQLGRLLVSGRAWISGAEQLVEAGS